MGIANIINTAGGGGGSSEIITHLVNSVDGAGLRLANQGYISCADVSANRFGTNDFSVEFVLSQETNAVNADIFISNLNGSNQAVDAAVIRWDVVQNDNIQLVFTNSGAAETAYNFGYDPAPDLNEPTHYLVSADRSGNAVLYRNGAEIASVSIAASGSANVGNSGQPTVIGSPVNNFGVKGNVYRLRTYSKALSSDEAKNVFDRADVPTALVSNLLLDLDCAYANPTQSTVIQDKGPNNQDGTLNGTITQTNVIKQGNLTSLRVGSGQTATPADNQVLVDGGTVGAPAYAFAHTTNTGMWSRGGGKLDFATGGVTRIAVDADGNVGIGQTPTANFGKLQVYATGDQTDETTAAFTIGDNATGGMRLFGGVNNTTNYAYIGAVESGTAYRDLLLQPSGGLVGIGTGTASPLAKLNVKGTQGNWRIDPDSVSTEIQALATNAANDGFIDYRLRANQVILDAGGSPRLTISSTGAVDISGPASHATALTVGNSTGGTELQVIPKENESITLNSAEGATAHALILATGGTPRLTVSSTGLATFSNGIALQTSPSNDSATANEAYTLDKYETGTFQLADGSGASLTITGGLGRYTRIGDRVFISVQFGMPSVTNGNHMTLEGLPFNTANNDASRGLIISYSGSANVAYSLTTANTDKVSFYTSAGVNASNTNASGASFWLNGHYRTA